ncbi:hypothetical protein GP486_001759 [Trichoglossum hirsutum]|uniref:Uncharacterized protein n=1 Tax=Trichoglossum hirsutum TaxID=265104 RepID=A0A9P8LG81_9PEZI|nr:hypothetical protein GP486_001759 [Trichoglossum hirsutum]
MEQICLVCRDYSAIDKFAKRFNLQNLGKLSELGDKCPLLTTEGKMLDITVLYAEYKSAKEQHEIDRELMRICSKIETQEGCSQQLKQAEETYQEAYDAYFGLLQTPENLDSDAEAKTEALQKRLKRLGEEYENANNQYLQVKSFIETNKLTNVFGQQEAKFKESTARVEELGRQFQTMLEWIAQSLWKLAVKEHIFHFNDHVGRARLFFTWVATSIIFDNDVKGQGDREDFRGPYDSLGTGREVCRGFAELFKELFDAVTKAFCGDYHWNPDLKAKLISGVSRRDVRHAWNAFPCNNGLTTWKLIDSCWAGGTKEHILREPGWFVQSNDEFLLTHLPESNDQSAITIEAFKNRPLVVPEYSCASRFMINILSVKPQDATLKRDVCVFEFSLCCPAAPKRQFFIAFKSGSGSVTEITPFAEENLRWITKINLKNAPKDPSCKVVIITPVFDTEGTVPFYDHKEREVYVWGTKNKLIIDTRFEFLAEWSIAK